MLMLNLWKENKNDRNQIVPYSVEEARALTNQAIGFAFKPPTIESSKCLRIHDNFIVHLAALGGCTLYIESVLATIEAQWNLKSLSQQYRQ